MTVLIPAWILSSRTRDEFAGGQPLRYLGVPLMIAGAWGLLWCIWQFYSEGRGTLAPVDPPKVLVVRGMYRYVRNPMYLGVLLTLVGEAIFFLSGWILVEAAIFFVMTHLFVKFYEEPALKRQFGPSYETYMRTVGRWIPQPKSRVNGH